MSHPLDRPVWNALSGRQSNVSIGHNHARRFAPDIGRFAAAADRSDTSLSALAALVRDSDVLWCVETEEWPAPPGCAITRRATCSQMLATSIAPSPRSLPWQPLGEADAADMLALATLTKPGPFYPRTHTLGQFIGVREHGQLVAMAGERMKPDGFTEVSGVCTHPDHRGHGYASGLMRVVAQRILDRGETPFLHVYADHAATIAMYVALGFSIRRDVALTLLQPARAPVASA